MTEKLDEMIDYYLQLADNRKNDDPEISIFYKGMANGLKIYASWLERPQQAE